MSPAAKQDPLLSMISNLISEANVSPLQNHFAKDLTYGEGKAYLKNNLIQETDFLSSMSHKRMFGKCLRAALYSVYLEYNPSKYDGTLTAKVWARFRENVRQWRDKYRPESGTVLTSEDPPSMSSVLKTVLHTTIPVLLYATIVGAGVYNALYNEGEVLTTDM